MKKCYVVKEGKLIRSNHFCPRCGEGVFMADKGELWSCGKCGDRYNKRALQICHVNNSMVCFMEGG